MFKWLTDIVKLYYCDPYRQRVIPAAVPMPECKPPKKDYSIERVSIKPDDTVVITSNNSLTKAGAEALKKEVSDLLGNDIKVLVLDADLKLTNVISLDAKKEVKVEAEEPKAPEIDYVTEYSGFRGDKNKEDLKKYDVTVNGEKLETIMRHYDNIGILIAGLTKRRDYETIWKWDEERAKPVEFKVVLKERQ